MFIFVKSLFCNSIETYNQTLKGLDSLYNFTKIITEPFSVVLMGYIGDYTLPHYNWKSCYIETWPDNRGKCFLYKRIGQLSHISQKDIIIYSDHDILFDERWNILDLLPYLENNEIVAPNQFGDCRHQPDAYTDNPLPHSIAFGCFISKASIFFDPNRIIDEYLYGPDDYLISQGLKKKCIFNIWVCHPETPNDDYKAWKLLEARKFFKCQGTI